MAQTRKQLTVSIVIPVYNEAAHLADCLDSIAAQIEQPLEVIVVDNNSSDDTAAVARRYPFVTLLSEHVQGTIPARDRGFNAANGDILGRIDGDVILAPNWVRRVRQRFEASSIGGLTGPIETDALPYTEKFRTSFWTRMYLLMSNAYFQVPIMLGGNMALRADAWRVIRSDACTESTLVHEDQDLSLTLAAYGYVVLQDKDLQARLPRGSTTHFDWPKLSEYIVRREMTRLYHRELGSLRRPGAVTLPRLRWATLHSLMVVPFALFALISKCIHASKVLKYEPDGE
jgi:glycosyltransferase involved in cell wall biosynthesis